MLCSPHVDRDGIFKSIDDLAIRVAELNRNELVLLARIGALNSLNEVEHRRDALWQVEQAGRPSWAIAARIKSCDKYACFEALETDDY